jgi:hypothetical protein
MLATRNWGELEAKHRDQRKEEQGIDGPYRAGTMRKQTEKYTRTMVYGVRRGSDRKNQMLTRKRTVNNDFVSELLTLR